MTENLDLNFWESSPQSRHNTHFRCKICNDGIWRDRKNCPRHERTEKHLKSVAFQQANQELHRLRERGSSTVDSSNHDFTFSIGDSSRGPKTITNGRSDSVNMIPDLASSGNVHKEFVTIDDHDCRLTHAESSGLAREPYLEKILVPHVGSKLAEWFLTAPPVVFDTYSDEEEPNESSDAEEEYVPNPRQLFARRFRATYTVEGNGWYPWPDKVICILDIVRHLPRSISLNKQSDLILWGMKTLQVPQVPSDDYLEGVAMCLQQACGIKSIRYEGALGHIYYVNDILQIISQEMANPKVRPYLDFLPEDGNGDLLGAHQGRRWLNELDPSSTTPMIRQSGQDFFIFEPTILLDQSFCIPVRWFRRGHDIMAKAWRIHPVLQPSGLGWVVYKYEEFDVPARSLSVSFTSFLSIYHQRGVPDPRSILGVICEPGKPLQPWTWTDPSIGNRWRPIADGCRVVAFPIWLYCDTASNSTSERGNNKHSSFYFTSAALLPEFSLLEYNVHFVSTSHIAEPLEQLEAIVKQIKEGQRSGIWAWDCILDELVVVIPSVLALLGDNPIQSEFSSHVGLDCNYFCRVCYCFKDERISDLASDDDAGDHDTSCADDDISESITKHERKRKRRKKGSGNKKRPETVQQLVDRARRFLTIGEIRSREKTEGILQQMFYKGLEAGGKARAKGLGEKFGVKDGYRDRVFVQMQLLQPISQGTGSSADSDQQLSEFTKTESGETRNPICGLQDIDANLHTPVEVFHVVLLGLVKYFWRDLMARLKKDQKDILIIQLNSLNITGLDCVPLSGRNFVESPGSLVGADFRVISQTAPFVLYDLLPTESYEAWLALCALVPLVYQHVIYGLEAYLAKLTNAIDHFLRCAMRCTLRWCNKPKLHLLLHLPEHIRLFGPAIHFSTEKFESYNRLVVECSTQSNRQAQSKTIGRSFAHANRIRHLLCGGKIMMGDISNMDIGLMERKANKSAGKPCMDNLHGVGSDVMHLIENDVEIRRFCAFPYPPEPKRGIKRDNHPARTWVSTIASTVVSEEAAQANELTNRTYVTLENFHVKNGEKCCVGDYVIVSKTGGQSIGKVSEILQMTGSDAELQRRPDYILVSICNAVASQKYRMPKLVKSSTCLLVDYDDILCIGNVQHDCYTNGCTVSKSEDICQERKTFTIKVQHVNEDDVIFNCAKMRDYHYIQQFRIEPTLYNLELALQEGSAKEMKLGGIHEGHQMEH